MGILDHPSSSGSTNSVPRGISSTSSGATSSGSGGVFGIDWSKWFPPLTSRSLLSHYLPASGAVSHTLYTVHLFSPNIISSIFPTGDLAVSNTILFNANVGLGFYVYFRRHLHRVNPWERVEFSVLSSTLFNFGSLLAAVLIKALFPTKTPTWLKSLTATVLSGYLLSRAAKYMGLLDHRASGRGSVSPARSVRSSPRHTAQSLIAHQNPNQKTPLSSSSPPPSVASSGFFSTSPQTPLTTTLPLETSNGGHLKMTWQPMTPSATEPSEFETSDFGASEDVGDSEDVDFRRPTSNYRYLHSYALNNLGNPYQNQKTGQTILRRTTMNSGGIQKTSNQSISFVTPEPSLINHAPYTPPPSRLQNSKTTSSGKSEKSRRRQIRKNNEIDDFDKILDFCQSHAPFFIVPIALGCWATGTVPLIGATWQFLFY
ncbi:hypothetical protein L5515_012506 [Caenorhabditis briggsae]|uniref:Uncharacterized protein n=1 Tax=Caenorhabditis briggsae TaxID=6238 RepID=A0AAE9F0Z0_CAEBR|nr:hypothetical protein L5515_012506 [Caenorhabditis briggsae]